MEPTPRMKANRQGDKIKLMNRKKRHGFAKYMFIRRKHRLIRRWLLRNPWMRPMIVFNFAAVRIQALGRSFITRNRIANCNLKSNATGDSRRGSNKQLAKYLQTIEQYSKLRRVKPKWLEGGFSSWCAVRIQAWTRMIPFYRRYNFKNRVVFQIAALVIQSAYRNILFRRIKHRLIVTTSSGLPVKRSRSRYDCALCIQLMWRSHCNKRVYRYFRDLIVDKLTGAPSDLLRTIIPNESSLLDRAAGVHVRFRLGGSVFPPKVLFKIYTHRPLCDVNSFAPRNYVEERDLTAYEKFNKSSVLKKAGAAIVAGRQPLKVGVKYFDTVVSTTVGADRWYQREENNSWRNISSQLLTDMFTPAWLHDVQAMRKKPAPFHYSQLRRKQDILLHKKRRRRQWMVKAYLMGHVDAASELADEQPMYPGRDNVQGDDAVRTDRSQIIHWVNEQEQAKESRNHDHRRAVLDDDRLDRNSITDSSFGRSMNTGLSASQHKNDMKFFEYGKEQSNKHHVYMPAALAKDKDVLAKAMTTTADNADTHEDLLKWSAALDFDEYSSQWSAIATSYARPLAKYK